MVKLTCIVCPQGCSLSVDENDDYRVTGNTCARGEEYGRKEMMNPERVVTSTVSISGAMHCRCPVKTKFPIPKRFVMDAMGLLLSVELVAPVAEGTVVVEDICGTGVPWVTTRELGVES